MPEYQIVCKMDGTTDQMKGHTIEFPRFTDARVFVTFAPHNGDENVHYIAERTDLLDAGDELSILSNSFDSSNRDLRPFIKPYNRR